MAKLSVTISIWDLPGFFMGMAVQHFGARKCGVLGGVLFSGGLLVSVFATSVNFLIVTFGVVSGRLLFFFNFATHFQGIQSTYLLMKSCLPCRM